MADSEYINWRKNENICPLTIPDKERLYYDLSNIEHSMTGRLDSNLGNTFILEAVQLLVNSIELFEMGYFDCAYFSLRSAVDISTTMVFLCDIDNEQREKYLNDWKNITDFPQRYKMIKKLSKEGSVFIGMTENMPDFFDEAEEESNKLNKYVHKQGLRNFYVSRNQPIFHVKSQEVFINNFIYHLEKVIGIVAIMRLAIDPFPVLLMDEDILYRCFDSLTEPYSEYFVDKYIGAKNIEDYKKTSFYNSTRASFENEEKKNEAVFSVMKYQYIDTTKKDDILSQLHLLCEDDKRVSLIVFACDKIVKAYIGNGLIMYTTDKKTNRKKTSWKGIDFLNFKKSSNKYNQKYDEAYISVFEIKDGAYLLEHNETITEEDIKTIKSIISQESI